MTIKIEDATANRPDGHRVIDAPVVIVDILDFTWKLKNEAAWEKSDRNSITVFKSGGITMVVTALHKGAAINDLKTDGLLSIQVLEGEISISSNKGEATLKEKQMIIIHPHEEQMLAAVEDAMLLLTNMKIEQEV